jgi:SAM-dependent methyltransferase
VPENRFDEEVAARYDAGSSDMFDAAVLDPAVAFLADLAAEGGALELGIGTGRVALPLSERGVAVQGIELSPAMVSRLRAKRGGEAIAVTIGDFATSRVDGSFGVVYLVYNTIMNLTTQAEQVECFRNAAAHLVPGGCFVVEVVVPDLRRLPPGQTVRPFAVSPNHVGFEEFTDMTEAQIAYSHHYWVGDDGTAEVFSAPYRYVWPSELDLMARLAGLTLRERWADWTRQIFTGESPAHVSVWEKP